MKINDYIQLWLHGKEFPPLFGLEMFWWRRIGLILGLFSGCYLVVEIIGPKKLRQFGRKLRAISKTRDCFLFIIASFQLLYFQIKYNYFHEDDSKSCLEKKPEGMKTLNFPMGRVPYIPIGGIPYSPPSYEYKESKTYYLEKMDSIKSEIYDLVESFPIYNWFRVIAMILFWIGMVMITPMEFVAIWPQDITIHCGFMLIGYVLSPFPIFLSSLLLFVLSLLLDVLILRPCAWFLEKYAKLRILKIISLFFLIIGFLISLVSGV